MYKMRRHVCDVGVDGLQLGQQLQHTKRTERVAALKSTDKGLSDRVQNVPVGEVNDTQAMPKMAKSYFNRLTAPTLTANPVNQLHQAS